MRCNQCGWENPNENAQCAKCGAQLGGVITETPPVRIQTPEAFDHNITLRGCPKCGYPVRKDDLRCPNCDNPLTPKGSPKQMGTVISVGDKQPKDAKRLAGFLITYDHNPVGEYFPVYEGRNIVGRDASANICIRGDEQVSEKHFALVYRTAEKKFKFKDELSSNGTFVNDTLADEGELTNFDVIRIGATRLLFIAIPDF